MRASVATLLTDMEQKRNSVQQKTSIRETELHVVTDIPCIIDLGFWKKYRSSKADLSEAKFSKKWHPGFQGRAKPNTFPLDEPIGELIDANLIYPFSR